jgi:hypothetical protein
MLGPSAGGLILGHCPYASGLVLLFARALYLGLMLDQNVRTYVRALC